MNPTWESDCGRVKLWLGDCLEVLPLLPEASVSAIITDPPYSSGGQFRSDRTQSTVSKYVQSGAPQDRRIEFTGDNRDQRSFLAWCSLWMTACERLAQPGAVFCCFCDWRQVPVVTDAVQCGGWTWRNLCTWWKPGCRMQKGRFSSSAEFVVYSTRGPHAADGERSPQNVFSCATLSGDAKEHIAEKPIEVMNWLTGCVKTDGLIFDPFFGSAATAVSAIRNQRPFWGIEKDPAYFDRAVARIKSELSQMQLFGGSQ